MMTLAELSENQADALPSLCADLHMDWFHSPCKTAVHLKNHLNRHLPEEKEPAGFSPVWRDAGYPLSWWFWPDRHDGRCSDARVRLSACSGEKTGPANQAKITDFAGTGQLS
jgi:hypothetical protein